MAIGVLSLGSQLCYSMSLKFETSASTVALLRKSGNILISFIVDIVYFKIIPAAMTVAGASVVLMCVFVGGIRSFLMERRVENKAAKTVLCIPNDNADSDTEDDKGDSKGWNGVYIKC